MPVEFHIANSIEEYEAARKLFIEYADYIQVNLCFQGFEQELKNLSTQYGGTAGGIILVKDDENEVGCAGIRKVDDETAELKRMYLKTEMQGKGIGKELLNRAILLASQLGYKKIRLDTIEDKMSVAVNLYRRIGFYEIPAYYHNPDNKALYMELVIDRNNNQ